MNISSLALLLGAYLIGSLSWGVIIGFAHGVDLRRKDLPGGSGVFRQLGPFWGVLTALLDISKGVLVAWLTLRNDPSLLPFTAALVVAGHCWPLYFHFSGGGGLAPSFGVLLFYNPGVTLNTLVLVLLIAALYYPWWSRSGGVLGIYPIPFAALFGFIYVLWALRDDPLGSRAAAGMAAVVVVRGLRLLQGKH